MTTDAGVFLGKGQKPQLLLLRRANRHGLIAGATGTGKTVSLRVLAEGFSHVGVPVFMADVKGDLTGLCAPGEAKPKLEERARAVGLDDYTHAGFPVMFWDLYGEQGHASRIPSFFKRRKARQRTSDARVCILRNDPVGDGDEFQAYWVSDKR